MKMLQVSARRGVGGDNNAAGLGGGWFSEWEPSLRSCVEPLGE